MDLSILYLKGSQVEISKFLYISVPEDYSLFIFANCADPDANRQLCRVSLL